MANYHLSAGEPVRRGAGKSAVAAAAYRSGEKLADERTGLLHDYTKRRGVLSSEIVMPGSAGDWRPDRAELWNAAERANKRGDAIIAREVEVSLPHELNASQRKALGLDLAKWVAEAYGVAVDVAFHAPIPEKGDNPLNFHMHMLMTAKRVKGDGFGTQALELDPYSSAYRGVNKDKPNAVAVMREVWATLANEHLAAAGLDERIDHRTLAAQGVDREATRHVGPHASAMERKGTATERGDANREIAVRNTRREDLKVEHAELSGAIIDLAARREQRTEERAERSAARTLDPIRILSGLTERRSTFTRFDLNRALSGEIADPKARSAFMDQVLARGDVVPLRESADAPVSRYTTRDVLASERAIMETARRMAEGGRFAVDADNRDRALARHGQLDEQQRAAVLRATGNEGFTILSGQAGTGKTTTLAAIRDSYEAQGFRVRGLAWQNSVMQRMRGAGFEAATIASDLRREQKGRGDWTSRTVLMVDEAAMLADKHLAGVLSAAAKAGAKVIAVQDKQQLGSIERGGMAAQLEQEHGAAQLTTVYRNRGEAEAWNAMHRGDFRAALETFDRKGAIQWAKEPEDAWAALVARWAGDTKSDPNKTSFVFAYTNAEVRELNADLRAIRRERGELGEDHLLRTKDGPTLFAEGDRVQFSGSARQRAQRDAGVYNGAAGVVTKIEDDRMTVRLDAAKGERAREVSFRVGVNAEAGEFGSVRHGYAGTIYKGQGDTVERSYVLHSDQWRAASGYVALTRHREGVAIFAAEKGAPWMMAQGGLEELDAKQRASAERSFAAWREAKPRAAQGRELGDYVAFVQGEAARDRDANRLDRMARQIGRIEEKRAAHQFHRDERPERPNVPPIVARAAELRAKWGETIRARRAAGAQPSQQPGNAWDAIRAEAKAEVTRDPGRPKDIREVMRERMRDRGRSR